MATSGPLYDLANSEISIVLWCIFSSVVKVTFTFLFICGGTLSVTVEDIPDLKIIQVPFLFWGEQRPGFGRMAMYFP